MRAYRNKFREYIKSEDQKDRDSLHVYFVREGISDKPANFDNAPAFVEQFVLSDALEDILLDIAILMMFAVFLFLAAYISFVRAYVN